MSQITGAAKDDKIEWLDLDIVSGHEASVRLLKTGRRRMKTPRHWGRTNSNLSAESQAHRDAPVFVLELPGLDGSLNELLDRVRNARPVAMPRLRSRPAKT
jgi:hypothetical protein